MTRVVRIFRLTSSTAGTSATAIEASLRPPQTAERRRSVAFLERGEDSWACFLVTFPATPGRWHGYFAFRPSHSEQEVDEVRTTDIFVEADESRIHEKARGLGRPLLRGLLDSAIHTSRPRESDPGHLRGRFRSLLTRSATDWQSAADRSSESLRSLYESYRLDQVAHFICLVEPDDFDEAVDLILDGKSIDFRTKDRVQYARMVVDHIEALLPLPDFKTWAADYRAQPDAYRLYSHTLHREGRLP